MDDGERGRGAFERVGAQLGGDGAGQEGLACAQITDQMNDGVGREGAGDGAARGHGLFLGLADESRHRGDRSKNP